MFKDHGFRFLRTAGSRLLRRGVSTMIFYGMATSPLLAEGTLKWQTSTDAAFALAKKENRFVILDLEAVWCHWCHVMEHDTYGNSDVRKKLNEHYVALKIDQDANPDIAARYGDWGWPATIVFAPDGSEIVKRRGFIEPQQMVALLDAIVADPSPGPSVEAASTVEMATTSTLDPARRKTLLETYTSAFNQEHGGWGDGQRYIDAPSVELAIEQARNGDDAAQKMVRQTLDQNLNLLDPVWGGVYQYSVSADWKSPHFEKIMSFQADDMRLYALAYAADHEQRYADAANGIFRYLTTNLRSPDGAFYVSQDADLNADVDGHAYYALDDGARRKLGMPRVDKHVYSRENGWAIAALCQINDSMGNAQALDIAKRAANWIVDHRSLPGGGFRHDERDAAGPYLADNLAMTQAFLSLYRSSGDRTWLTKGEATSAFIEAHFHAKDGGYFTAPSPKNARGVFALPTRFADENIALARTANLLFRTTGNTKYRAMSENAMHFLTSASVVDSRPFFPGLLLADREMTSEPIHIAIVGGKDDAAAKNLHVVALAYPESYLRVDWWDKREGPLPNPDVTYPTLAKAAAFACTGNACSLPVFDPQKIAPTVDRLRAPVVNAN